MGEEIRGNALYMSLLETLEKYFSRITALTIVRRTLEAEKIDPQRLTRNDLEKIYQSSIFVGVRAFCPPEKLTDAMMDLAKLLE